MIYSANAPPWEGHEILAKNFAGPIQRRDFLTVISSFAESLEMLIVLAQTPALTRSDLQWAIYSMGIASHLSLVMGLPLRQLSIEDLWTGILSHCGHPPPYPQINWQMIKLVQCAKDALKQITGKMSRKTRQVSHCPICHTLFNLYSQSCWITMGPSNKNGLSCLHTDK